MPKLEPKSFSELKEYSSNLAKSGYFEDVNKSTQAMAKIKAGQELGFPAMASLTNIHIAKGKIQLGVHLVASAIKKSDKYDYRVKEKSNKKCTIDFLEGDEVIGQTTWTLEDAKRAGLYPRKDNWEKYPRQMLYSRAMTEGGRTYCPDVFMGGVYVEDELEDDFDNKSSAKVEKTQEVQETEFTIEDGNDTSKEESTDNDQSEQSEDDSNGSNSTSNGNSEPNSSNDGSNNDNTLTNDQLKKLNTIGNEFYDLQEWNDKTWDDKRPDLVNQATDGRTNSSKELTKDEASDLIDNLQKQLNFYQNALNNFRDDYKLAKKFASKIDGTTGKGTHDELIEGIESVINPQDSEDESDESDEDNEDEDSHEDLEF